MSKISVARSIIQTLLATCLYFIGHFMWEPIVGAEMCIAFWIGAATMLFEE